MPYLNFYMWMERAFEKIGLAKTSYDGTEEVWRLKTDVYYSTLRQCVWHELFAHNRSFCKHGKYCFSD